MKPRNFPGRKQTRREFAKAEGTGDLRAISMEAVQRIEQARTIRTKKKRGATK